MSGDAAGSHFGARGALLALVHVEERSLIRRLAHLDAEDARHDVRELVRALVRVSKIGREHRVEGNLPEGPASRRERVANSLGVVDNQPG